MARFFQSNEDDTYYSQASSSKTGSRLNIYNSWSKYCNLLKEIQLYVPSEPNEILNSTRK